MQRLQGYLTRTGTLPIAVAVLCTAVLVIVPALADVPQGAPREVSIDLSSWIRRDNKRCTSDTHLRIVDGRAHIESEDSFALFWQTPTIHGHAMEMDAERHPWIVKCSRPPRSLNSEIEKWGADDLIDVSEFRRFSWRWKVDEVTSRFQELRRDGKLETKYDDFPAKIGITVLRKGSDDLREVAYVWSRHLPEGEMFTSETTVIPLPWKLRWGRFVVESGEENLGKWVEESRNLYEDYRRIYPGEEPGRILRVYLCTDSDNTSSRASAWYDAFSFRHEPER